VGSPGAAPRPLAGWAALILLALALGFFFLDASEARSRAKGEDRTFHVLDLASFASLSPDASIPSHVEVTGWVTLKKVEADGDVHLRLSDGDLFIVAECVPEIPAISAQCKAIKKWTKVRVRGISRYDGAPGHGWHEVHPVLGIEVVP
jgi:hypothetical protein